ncbi:MAG: hypothetical protein R2883_05525 [Caldisericia bacterium]
MKRLSIVAIVVAIVMFVASFMVVMGQQDYSTMNLITLNLKIQKHTQ